MASAVPDKLKPAQIGAFANRANQLERHKPIITYWRRSLRASIGSPELH